MKPEPRPLPKAGDRKSTRLNSSHGSISYAGFCLKKKKKRAPGTSWWNGTRRWSVRSAVCSCCTPKTSMTSAIPCCYYLFFFFFNDTATTEIYTLSLHDALPIFHEYEVSNILSPEGLGGWVLL